MFRVGIRWSVYNNPSFALAQFYANVNVLAGWLAYVYSDSSFSSQGILTTTKPTFGSIS